MAETFAFVVTVDVDDTHRQCIVAASDLATASATAHARLANHYGDSARIVRMVLLAETLEEPRTPRTAARQPMTPARPPAMTRVRAAPRGTPTASRVTPQTQQPGTNPHGGTRRDQLLALLRERGGPVHVSEIARSLGISRPHASGVAIKASRAGLAWRLRAGTGYYHQALDVGGPPPELIDATPERPRTRKARSTRQDQLVALLLQRGGPVHLDEVAEELGFKRVNADVLASRAVKAGIVQRVGRLSSRIALPNWQQHPPPDGIQRRAYNGCDPRAGHAASPSGSRWGGVG